MEALLQRIADHLDTFGAFDGITYDGDNMILVHADGKLLCLTATDLTGEGETQ